MSGSIMLISDGVHSLSDGGSNIVGLVGISIAERPPDKTHPYGHRKFETLAAFIISFALFFAAFTILREGFERFFFEAPPPRVTPLVFGVMAVTLAANIFIALWERRQGKALQSDFLIADSWHTLSDCWVSVTVILALIGIKLGLPHVDAIISIGIAIFIAWVAFRMLRNTSDVLADGAALDEAKIRSIVESFPDVEACHEIRSRGRIDDIHVDLHVLVDPEMSVDESHKLAHRIEDRLRADLSGIREVLVHVEPSHHDHG